MDTNERDLLAEAEHKISGAIKLLMEPPMHAIPGIREAREAVIAAQNLVNQLLSGTREN
jgi:hypothetical protein